MLRQCGFTVGGRSAFSAPAFLSRHAMSILVRALAAASLVFSGAAFASPPDDSALRQKLVQTISSQGAPQQKLLGELAESGAKVVRDVLVAWSRDGLYIYDAPDGSKVPVLLEEQQDAAGKVRAIRVLDGQFVKDAKGGDIRFADNDLSTADVDMRLRGAIQQTLDSLDLVDPDPQARMSAVVKLGYSQKAQYLPVLQARLGKETDGEVVKAIQEGVALLQLNSPDVQTQLAAIQQLRRLNAMGAADTLKRLADKANGPPEVARAARIAVHGIEDHISVVNLFGTIFRGLSLGSILLVVALGLAITFGLMGIINMAHGEMIAVGAYTCYVVQNLFGSGFGFSIMLPFNFWGTPLSFGLHLPGLNATGWLYESYFLFAIPLSFVMAALAGWFSSAPSFAFFTAARWNRLLATWGVSLVMQQLFPHGLWRQ